MKVLMVGVAAAALLAAAVGAQAQGKKYSFALVPKNMNNPFFDQARDGCKKAEKELQGAIDSVYVRGRPVVQNRRAANDQPFGEHVPSHNAVRAEVVA